MTKRTHDKSRKYWVDKIRIVNVEGVELKITVDAKHYDRFFDQKVLDERNKNYLKPDEATEWVYNSIIG